MRPMSASARPDRDPGPGGKLRPRPGPPQRAAAVGALVLAAATLALAAYIVVDQFPQNLVFAGLILFALSSAWFGLLRRGAQRMLGLVISLTALVAALAVLLAT